jgi:hypothetical protein
MDLTYRRPFPNLVTVLGTPAVGLGDPDPAVAGRIVADLTDRRDRVVQRHVPQDHAGLDYAQHQVGRANLEWFRS